MSTTGRTADGAAGAESAAAAIREAGFVRVVSHADGAGLAAAGVLARGLDDRGIPFQVSVARTDGAAAETLAAADPESATVTFGVDPDAIAATDSGSVPDHAGFDTDGAAVRDAAAVVRELGATPSEPLVLAGLRLAGEVPTGDDGAFERRPGVGLPVDDLGDGLAHSTLVHGEFSGDSSRAGATLAELGLPAELDESAHRRLASHVAIEATAGPAPDRTADALQWALHPHVYADCAFATIEGFGDVLDSLARYAPGHGVATAIGQLDRTVALDAWRAHGEAVHAAVTRAGIPAESDDHVATASVTEADPVTVARLLRDFATDAPNVLVTGEDGAALATTEANARETLVAADADAVGGTGTLAYATVDTGDESEDGDSKPDDSEDGDSKPDDSEDGDSEPDTLDALAARVRGVL